MAFTEIRKLIVKARNGSTQAEFARQLGVDQSSLCRYETGKTNPPVKVIERCMQIVQAAEGGDVPSVEALAQQVQEVLGRDDQGPLRMALSRIIDGLTGSEGARGVSQKSS